MVKAAAAFKPTNSGSFKRHIGLLIEAGFKRTEINEALTAAGSSEISGRQFTEAGAAGKAGSIKLTISDMHLPAAAWSYIACLCLPFDFVLSEILVV